MPVQKKVWKLIEGITYLPYLPTPSARAGYDTRSIFKRSLTGFNSEFSFSETCCLNKVEESSLPYYLPIAGGRIIGFIPFSRVLVLCEMQSVSSRIWTRVAVSISDDDNHYTTGTTYLHTLSNYIKCPVSFCLPLYSISVRITKTRHFDSIHRGKMEQILLADGAPKETVATIMIL